MTEKTSVKDIQLPQSDFVALQSHIREVNLYQRTYVAHALNTLIAIAGFSLSLVIVTLSDSLLVQLLNAVVFGFFTVQLGLIGHDLSHGGVFSSHQRGRRVALFVWGFFCGLSEGRWFYKHNKHHQEPNHIGHDPDLEIPFVFSDEQAALRSDFSKQWLFPYQHILFWIGIWFVYPYNLLNSAKFLFGHWDRRAILELGLMLAHYILVFGLLFYFLPFAVAVMFIVVSFLVTGAYMGLIFAPNHKGEEMLEADETFNWVHQITLTRNIIPSPLVSYIFGGLEYQIEHHLFPNMSRFQYRHAQQIIKDFCGEKGIPYHETTWSESMRQIHEALKAESAVWRRG